MACSEITCIGVQGSISERSMLEYHCYKILSREWGLDMGMGLCVVTQFQVTNSMTSALGKGRSFKNNRVCIFITKSTYTENAYL